MKRLIWLNERRIVIVLFAVALLVYLPGISWGLPYATAPDRVHAWGSDELAPLGPIAELYSAIVAHHPPYNPQYPLFHYMVQALAVSPYMLLLWLIGGLSYPSIEYPFGLSNPVVSLEVMTLLARAVSLFMAAAVVVIAYRTATILWDRTTGVIAGVFVLLIYPMFYYARTSNVDMAAIFWISIGIAIFASVLLDSLTPWRAMAFGICAALATATKDASYAVFVPLLAVVLPLHVGRQLRLGSTLWAAMQAPLITVFSGSVVYIVASGLVFNIDRYLSHLDFIMHGSPRTQGLTYFSIPPTIAGYVGLIADTGGQVIDAMGAPMALVALGGIALCIMRRPQPLTLALAVLGVLLGVVFPVRFVLLRFVIVIALVLAFFAAHGLATALRAPQPMIRRFAQLLLLVVCGWSFLRGADLTYQMIYDSRYEVAAWLKQNTTDGNRIGYFGTPDTLPPLGKGVVSISAVGLLETLSPTDAQRVGPEFLIVNPQQPFETVHEFTLPDRIYEALRDGSLGYQQVVGLQAPSMFSRRPVSFVNPPVKVFVRKDYLTKLPGPQSRIETNQ